MYDNTIDISDSSHVVHGFFSLPVALWARYTLYSISIIGNIGPEGEVFSLRSFTIISMTAIDKPRMTFCIL